MMSGPILRTLCVAIRVSIPLSTSFVDSMPFSFSLMVFSESYLFMAYWSRVSLSFVESDMMPFAGARLIRIFNVFIILGGNAVHAGCWRAKSPLAKRLQGTKGAACSLCVRRGGQHSHRDRRVP